MEVLNEKQKHKIVEDFNEVGELVGLERIAQELYINNIKDEETTTLLRYVITLNCLVVETEQSIEYAKYNNLVQELYYTMKCDLLDKIGITEDYFKEI